MNLGKLELAQAGGHFDYDDDQNHTQIEEHTFETEYNDTVNNTMDDIVSSSSQESKRNTKTLCSFLCIEFIRGPGYEWLLPVTYISLILLATGISLLFNRCPPFKMFNM